MKMIRSFIAIPLAPPIQTGAAKLIQKIRVEGDGMKWIRGDNFHLTLKFLGDVDNTEIHNVCQAVREVCEPFPPIDLEFQGVGGFPSLERPRVLYAGIKEPTGQLAEMAHKLDVRLADMRFKRESRDFTPHLTLARVKRPLRVAPNEVVQRASEHINAQLGAMTADIVEVVASFLDKHGPTYQVMDTIDLQGSPDESP